MNQADEILPLLKRVGLFEGLPPEDLRRIAEVGEERHASAGETLFREGDEGDAFYAVISGSVEIFRARSDGGEERLAIRRGGDAFGEMALLDDAARSATARAKEDARLFVLERGPFRSLLDPASPAFRMLASLSRALRALDIRFTAGERMGAGGNGVREMNRVLRQGILPRTVPPVVGWEIAGGTSVLSEGEGSTSWDTFALSDGAPVFAVLHTRGDGIPPAPALAVARGVFRALARSAGSAEELLSGANEIMAELAIPGVEQFVECALMELRGGTVRWAAAGRPPGAVVKGGGWEALPNSGPPLGVMTGFRYVARECPVGAGDAVFALSEGSEGLLKGAADLVAKLGERSASDVVTLLHRAFERAADAPAEASVVFTRRAE